MSASPTFRRRRLARRIRELREKSGLTQETAASELDMSKSALSRKENGDAATSVHEARSMMDLYDIYDPELLDLARAAREKGWWRAYGIEDRCYVDLETEARTVREMSLMYIPGLIQTEEYLRALFRTDQSSRSREHLENDVAVRLIRQQRLTDSDDPFELIALVDEAALHRPIGGVDVMREQLRHVIRQAETLSSLSLRVLPIAAGCHQGMEGAFTLLDFPDPEEHDVLFVSHPSGSLHVEKVPEVREARRVFDHLLSGALPEDASLAVIEEAAREL